MLMGAAANLAPELFAGVIADVPFVDVLNTMLDADLPLTPPEWLEWGNPIARRRRLRDDPLLFALRQCEGAALSADPRARRIDRSARHLLGAVEMDASACARRMTGGGPILCKTNMGAGHGGAPGRFDRLEDVALQYAFALACVEGAFAAS